MDKVNVKMFNLIYSKYYPRVIDVKKLLKHVLNAWPHEDMLLKKGTPRGSSERTLRTIELASMSKAIQRGLSCYRRAHLVTSGHRDTWRGILDWC